jgi:lipoprotein-releasing system permease protein
VFPNGTGQQFKVGGLIDSGFYDFDNGVVLMPYRTLVEVGGKENIASSVVVRVQDESQVDAIALQVNQLTPQDKVETWVELSPYVQLILQTQNYRTMVSVTLILLTAGFSMISAMVIKVSSRTRYIGMTKAMGATGGFILATYLMQAAAIGMVGGILGDAWAYLGYSYLSTYQITVAGLEKTLGTATIPFHLNPSTYLSSFIFATVVCILSALYPAYRASRLEVTETVRHA